MVHVAVVSAHWDAYGVLTFPKPGAIADWRSATVDDAACKVVERLARGMPSEETIGAVVGAFDDEPRTLVRCAAKGAVVTVDYAFDGDLLLEHGAVLFGALARAGAFGATGTVWIEDDMHPAYVLTVAAKSKLAKWDKKKTTAPDDLVERHRALVAKTLG